MAQKWDDGEFEDYRRGRRKYHLESGPKRDLGKRSGVLRELEEAEAEEIRNEQISREVCDFFSDATRTAAEIVARVSQVEEHERVETVGTEMVDFLHDAIDRAQHLILQLRTNTSMETAGLTDIEPNLHNIVGAQLDGFRYEGTARVGDKHIGENPFAVGIDGERDETVEPVDATHDTDALGIEHHLAAELAEVDEAVPENAFDDWVQSLRTDPRQLASTLKVLVAGAVLKKDRALSIFHAMTEGVERSNEA